MCGIAGVVSFGRPVLQPELSAALSVLAHRGPDATGEWVDETGRTWLGAQRLAIIDLRRAADQPMRVGPLVVLHNGEIYDHPELRADLERRGHSFRTRSDTEVLGAAYLEWGHAMIGRLNGMFATAIWDTRDRSLFLCRDRFGEKPLYYAALPDRFIFASEPKAILRLRGGAAAADEEVLLRFIATGDVPDGTGRTFFDGVRQLQAATYATLKTGSVLAERRYWSIVPARVGAREAGDALVALLEDSTRLRRRADVPLGATLSGGIDSTLAVALAARFGPIRTILASVGGPSDELAHATRAAEQIGVPLQVVHVGPEDLVADIDRFVWHQDEPVPHTSQLAHWAVMKAARESGLKVLLEGQGADELFGGYHAPSFGHHWRDLVSGGRLVRVVGELRSYARMHQVPLTRPLAYLVAALLPRTIAERARRDVRGFGRSLVSPPGPEADDRVGRRGSALGRELSMQLWRTSLPSILRYVDRNSMAHSVEVRLPFLDHRIAEFAAGLPSTSLVSDGVTKVVVRDALRRAGLPETADRRDKIGFATPERAWLHGALRGWARERVAAAARRPYYRPGAVETAWRTFDAGRLDSATIWRIVHAELWTARFIDGWRP